MGVLLGLVVTAPGAAADYPHDSPDRVDVLLDIPEVSDVEADVDNGHVFVAGGRISTALQVLDDRTGRLREALPGTSTATDVVVVRDRGVAFVALPGQQSIGTVDLETLSTTTSPMPTGICPERVTWTADLVWFFNDCRGAGPQELAQHLYAFDPGTGETYGPLLETWGLEELMASPDDPGRLWYRSLTSVSEVSLTGLPQPSASTAAYEVSSGGWYDMDLSADGAHLYNTGSSLADVSPVVETEGYGLVDHYPAGRLTVAVDVRNDGAYAVGSLDDGGVAVYAPGESTTAQRIYIEGHDLPVDTHRIAYGGVGLGRERVFVARRPDPGEDRVLVQSWLVDLPDGPLLGKRVVDMTTYFDIVGDPRRDRWFLSPGPSGNGLAAVGRRGRVTRVVADLPGASQMALDRASRTLFVVLPAFRTIAEIDLDTWKVTKHLVAGDGTPELSAAVAVARGLVWFGGDGLGLSALDPDTGGVHTGLAPLEADTLQASPADPRTLVGVDSNTMDSTISTYRVRGGNAPSARLVKRLWTSARNATEAVPTPDGLHVVVPIPVFGEHVVLRADDLGLAGLVPTEWHPVAASVRSDSLTALGTGDFDPSANAAWGLPAYLHASPLGRRVGRLRIDGPSDWVQVRGLAFARRNLAGVFEAYHGKYDIVKPHLQLWRMPPLAKVGLTLDRAVYRERDRGTAVVRLAGSVDRPARVRLVALKDGRRRLVGQDRPGRSGRSEFTFSARDGLRLRAVVTHKTRRWVRTVPVPTSDEDQPQSLERALRP